MRVWISWLFLLTRYAIGEPEPELTSPVATTERSTPEPISSPSTLFDKLDYWSGESLKVTKSNKDCKENNREFNIDDSTAKNETSKKKKSGRRINQVYDPKSVEEHEKSTRYAEWDGEHTSHMPEEHSNETAKAQKLNGYTLLEDMTELMEQLKANTSVSVISRTAEYHNIVLVKISAKHSSRFFRALDDKYVDEKPEKKIILIVHGLSPMGFATVPCLFNKHSFMKLVKMYAKHLDKFDIFLIPMGNPDGIADETLQLWNKNKSPQKACAGVNVDRNFDVRWNKSHGISPCLQSYPGPAPFSEMESRAIADLIHHYNHKIVAYIHVHAGTYSPRSFKGDAVLYPRGYEDKPIDDKYSDLDAGIEESMRNAGFKVYGITLASLYRWYGQVYGTSVDYATTVYGIPYAMEFVLQAYQDYRITTTTSEEMQDNVLTEVWQRVIDVIFPTIHKYTTPNTDEDL
ncbi:zinc carboxypeptidase-like isoform X2 [Leguminivora glycinivorella]|uniref:zinc carboxypeptidase-like isoform X2 n=1 Tax=Leguminivora glycinivorella TaxID=1035111 RepID=UPI002010BA6F|nr:zinc carboxypeptidase-like isoform X2 [Leguminivora glycinivorella]